MRYLLLTILAVLFFGVFTTQAGVIQYIGNGKDGPDVKIAFSRSNGDKWERKILKPGQTFHIPKDATHLQINGSPRNPKQNFRVKDGHVY